MKDAKVLTDPAQVRRVAADIEASGLLVFDLEFVSQDRYIPDLALVQVAWGDPGDPEVAAIDPLAADLQPIFDLVASDAVLAVAHGARQDLALLATRYQVRAGLLVDTQIAAAFAGIGEQVGYAKLVARLCGVNLDKKHQFTDWLRRPLKDAQIGYALDDVRYLGRVWAHLRAELETSARLSWAFEESARMAAEVAERRRPEDAYLSVGGAANLRGRALGSLKALAAWREQLAVDTNTPPSWIASDAAMVELCRRHAKSERDLRRARGLGGQAVRDHGPAMLEAIAAGAAESVTTAALEPLSSAEQTWAQVALAIAHGAAAAAGISARQVASRGDAEALVRWFSSQAPEPPAELLLATGWRRELVGEALIAWLEGKKAAVAVPGGLTLVDV